MIINKYTISYRGVHMCDKRKNSPSEDEYGSNREYLEHCLIIGSSSIDFSVEPSTEKDYDILTMTGYNNEENNSEKGSDEQ